MRFWGGQLEWQTDAEFPNGGYWRPPVGARVEIDFRSHDQCGVPVTPTGYGIFSTADAVSLSGYDDFGTDPDSVLTGVLKGRLRSVLTLPGNIVAMDLRSAVREAMTVQADPTGSRCLPLVPNRRHFELYFGGQVLRWPMLDGTEPEFAPVLDLLRRQYRQYRQAVMDDELPQDHHRKILGHWVRKYGLPYRAFQPAGVPDESDLPPTTIITDNCTRADTDLTPNTPSEGWSWVQDSGVVFGISTNRLYMVSNTTSGSMKADSALSGADHSAECLIDSASGCGPCVRYAAAAITFYHFRRTTAGSTCTCFKCVTGTFTSLRTPSNATALPHTLKISANGTTIELFVPTSTSIDSFTDSAIASNVRTGLRSGNTGTGHTADDFVGQDLAAAGRTTKNTRSNPLGVNVGMGFRMGV